MGQMVKEETVLHQNKPAVKNHAIVHKPPPSHVQPVAVAPGSTAMGTTSHSQHNSLPPQVRSVFCYYYYYYYFLKNEFWAY